MVAVFSFEYPNSYHSQLRSTHNKYMNQYLANGFGHFVNMILVIPIQINLKTDAAASSRILFQGITAAQVVPESNSPEKIFDINFLVLC